MSIIKIPSEGRFLQTNKSDIGDIQASYNLDPISNQGKIRISNPAFIVASDTSSSFFVSFVRSSASGSDLWWTLGNGGLQINSGTAFTVTGIPAGTPTGMDYRYSDLIEWEEEADVGLSLLCINGTSIAKLTGGTWNNNWMGDLTGATTGLTASVPHPMCVGFNSVLYIGNGNKVASIDNAEPNVLNKSRLTFEKEFEVRWIRTSNSAIFVGCRNTQTRQGKVFVFDGYSQNFNADYRVGSEIPLTGIIKDEVLYIVNNAGQLLAFNGGGFSEVAQFPVKDNLLQWTDTNNFQIHPNGSALIDNQLHFLVNASMNNNYMLPNFLSGIWAFLPEAGLFHRYGITKVTTGFSGMDYGSPMVSFVGALVNTQKITSNFGSFFAGCNISQTGTGNAIGIINKLNTGTADKSGYFVTPKIKGDVEEQWQKVFVITKKLLNSTDKYYIKYKVDDKDFGDAKRLRNEATWVSTSSFTCNVTDATTYVAVGDEVEILQGEGSGISANVSAINGSLFTIDETVANASGDMYVRFDNWKKTGNEMATQGLRYFEHPINDPSDEIQFKVVAFVKNKNGENNEIKSIIVKSEPHVRI